MSMLKRDNEKLQTRLNDVTEKEEQSMADLMHSVLENQLMHAQVGGSLWITNKQTNKPIM